MIIYGARTRKPEAMVETIALTDSSVVFAFNTRHSEMPIHIPILDKNGYMYRSTDVLHINNLIKEEHAYGFVRVRKVHFESHVARPLVPDSNRDILIRALAFRKTYLKSQTLEPAKFLTDVFPYADPLSRFHLRYVPCSYQRTSNPRVLSFGSGDIYMSATVFRNPSLQLIEKLKNISRDVELVTFIRDSNLLYWFLISPNMKITDKRGELKGLDFTSLVHSRIADTYALTCPLYPEFKEDY